MAQSLFSRFFCRANFVILGLCVVVLFFFQNTLGLARLSTPTATIRMARALNLTFTNF